MKKIKCIVILLIPLFCVMVIYSQKNNRIYFSTSNTWYPRTSLKRFDPSDQYGLGYTRKVNSKMAIDLFYSQWYTSKFEKFVYYRYQCSIFDKSCEKKIEYRRNYKFIDVVLEYTLFYNKKLGDFKIQLGMGAAWGINRLIDTIIVPTVPPYDYYEVKGHNEAACYLGIIPALSYDYYLWKSKINIGVHFKARKYFATKEPLFQTDQGIHLGYNF